MTTASDLREILRGRDFRRLYTTRLVSQLSDGMFQAALAGFVFFSPEQQTSAGQVAVAFAVLLLPYSAIGPFAGVFIDRWSRRQILVWSPLLRAALVGAVATLVLSGEVGVLFYTTALLVFGVNRFFLASLSAGLPHVVSLRQLVPANALSVTSGTVIAFAGAALGYLLRSATGGGNRGTALILVCSSIAYVLASMSALRLGRDRLGPDLEDGADRAVRIGAALRVVARGLADGVRHVRDRPPAALALGVISLHRFLYGIVLVMTVLLFRYRFGSEAATETGTEAAADAGLSGFAVALTISGLGFLIGALITPYATRRLGKDTWIVLLLLTAAAGLLLLGLPFAPVPWVAGSFVLGVVSQGVKVTVDSIVQETVADAYRGRVFAAYDMLFNTTFVGAAAVAAATVSADGRSVPVLCGIIAAYVLAALVYRRLARATGRGRPRMSPS